MRLVLGAVVLASLASLGAPPLFSDDVYRYLWDGHVALSGIDPYAFAPNDPEIAELRTVHWSQINHPEVPTIYPPLAQALFFLAALLGGQVWTVQLLGALAHIGCTLWLAYRAPRGGMVAALLFGLNPLALRETTMMGHLDVVVGLSLALAAVEIVRGRPVRAVLWTGAASAMKLVGIICAPLLSLSSRHWVFPALVLALLPLFFVAQAGHASGEPGGMHHYARRWAGNAGGFLLVERACRFVVDGVANRNGSGPGRITLDPLRPMLESIHGSDLDPRLGFRGPKKPPADIATFPRHFASGMLARATCVSLAILFLLWLMRRRGDPILSFRAMVFTVLLLSPQVHPWYLLWLLPLEALARRYAGFVWSAIVLVAYAPLEGWLIAREWVLSPWIVGLEYGTLGVILMSEYMGDRGNIFASIYRWSRRLFAKAPQIGDSTS